MGLRKGFRITTWLISIIAFIGWVVSWVVGGRCDSFCLFAAFASFAGIWIVYWILFWSVRGFHKMSKGAILQIIKWAVIIFFASILFHLADYVVHKTIKAFEEKPRSVGFGSKAK